MNLQQRMDQAKEMATLVGGFSRLSAGGTPHVLVRVGSMAVSVCYVTSMHRWRVFYPYGQSKQTKVTCKYPSDVVTCLEGLR